MPKFLKTLLLWLLLALLPFQGIAAPTRVVCHLVEQYDSVATSISSEHHHGDAHAAMSGHGASMQHHASAQSTQKSSAEKHHHSSCGSCASCCVGACAPPFTPALSPPEQESLAADLAPSPLVTGFIPSGPERPPKRISA